MADQAVPLSEALQHFSEQSDWEELVGLERYAIVIFWAGQPQTESERQHWRYRRLKERLETEFLGKLMTGSLVATGFLWPIGLNAKRRIIPAARWSLLTPDFAASEVTGGGLRIVDVRVQAAQTARTSSSLHPAREPLPREYSSLARLRADVRRWLQREARVRGPRWQKKHYCDAARAKFGDRVTDNLFNEVWRSANLPEALRRPGLRKIDDRLADTSPPASQSPKP